MPNNKSKNIILRPRITEKGTRTVELINSYIFEVHSDATKPQISKAIEDIYKVKPKKINIVNLPAKTVYYRGKKGKKASMKKAYVYLKKGDKIEFV